MGRAPHTMQLTNAVLTRFARICTRDQVLLSSQYVCPHNSLLAHHVCLQGAERQVRLPQDLLRFQHLPMSVAFFLDNSDK